MDRRMLLTVFYTSALVLIWGVSWSVRKVGLAYAPPLVFAGMYTLGGGLLLAASHRRRFPWRENWPVYAWSALLNVALFMGIQNVALKLLPSGLLTVLVYVGPVLAGFLAYLWLGEALSGPRIAGLLLGFAGVILVSLAGLNGRTSLTGILLGLVAGVTWAFGTVFTKRVQSRVDAFQLVTGQFLLGGALLLAIGLAAGQWPLIRWTWPLGWSLAFSLVFSIAVAWSLWMHLLRRGEVARVSGAVFSVPILAVGIGTIGLGEPLTWSLVAGLACTAAGISLVNRPQRSAAASTGNRAHRP